MDVTPQGLPFGLPQPGTGRRVGLLPRRLAQRQQPTFSHASWNLVTGSVVNSRHTIGLAPLGARFPRFNGPQRQRRLAGFALGHLQRDWAINSRATGFDTWSFAKSVTDYGDSFSPVEKEQLESGFDFAYDDVASPAVWFFRDRKSVV